MIDKNEKTILKYLVKRKEETVKRSELYDILGDTNLGKKVFSKFSTSLKNLPNPFI